MQLLSISSYADFQATPEAVLVYRLGVRKALLEIEQRKQAPGQRGVPS